MPRYSETFKLQVVRKMTPPDAQLVAQVHRETGISEPTLYAWRNRQPAEGPVVTADPSNPVNWSGQNNMAVVIETAQLNEPELAEYCRRKRLYPGQIVRWREAAAGANGGPRKFSAVEQRQLQAERNKSRRMENALNRGTLCDGGRL